jgi:hypothetical protein
MQPKRELHSNKCQQMKIKESKIAFIWGGLIPRARYKFEGSIAAKHRASELEIHPGALLTIPPVNLSRTYALPASITALEGNPKNRPRRTAVRG